MTADAPKVVNLNKARKAHAKSQARATADANALRFGRTKSQREAENAAREKAARTLDAHRRDNDANDPDTGGTPH
jgi:phage protein D